MIGLHVNFELQGRIVKTLGAGGTGHNKYNKPTKRDIKKDSRTNQDPIETKQKQTCIFILYFWIVTVMKNWIFTYA